MSKYIKGYIQDSCNKYPIGIETPLTDINGKLLLTGDTVSLNNGHQTVVCTPRGDIMGIWGTNKKGIYEFNVKKIKSYKDLKNGEEFKGYNLKVVLEKTKQNKVENIKHIINGRTTIVILENGKKGIAKCHSNDKFDKHEGFKIAYARANGKEIDDEENEFKINEGLWNEFVNVQMAVNCKTKKEEELFFKYLNNNDITWNSGCNIFESEIYEYDNYKNNTCFCMSLGGIQYGKKNFYMEDSYKIITFEELFNLNPPKQLSDYTNEELLEELENRLK
ncbi:hypothetical protein [Clostridium sp. CTA-6]